MDNFVQRIRGLQAINQGIPSPGLVREMSRPLQLDKDLAAHALWLQ